MMLSATKLDKNKIRNLLKEESDYIADLLTTFNVPDSIENIDYKDYLLNGKENGAKPLQDGKVATVDELEDRLNTIKNKMKKKKRPVSERSQRKREAKKLKKNKEFKKAMLNVHKTVAGVQTFVKTEPKSESTSGPAPKPIFNTEGKIVFSKFDFAAHPGAKSKKSKKEKVMKNPKQILQKIKETDRNIRELQEQGNEDKVKELNTEMAWKKAFDKVDGKKVRDDPKLLYKAIKRRKDEKKKSKKNWQERKNKVEQTIQNKQKKRTENINKKLKEKRTKKLKKLTKKGRVIPGF